MTPFVLLLGFAAALGDLIGGAIVATPRHISDRTLTLLMALGAGNLLGVSVIELIPESIKEVGESAPLYILGGYLLIHFFEHVFAPHLHFGEETHANSVIDSPPRAAAPCRPSREKRRDMARTLTERGFLRSPHGLARRPRWRPKHWRVELRHPRPAGVMLPN